MTSIENTEQARDQDFLVLVQQVNTIQTNEQVQNKEQIKLLNMTYTKIEAQSAAQNPTMEKIEHQLKAELANSQANNNQTFSRIQTEVDKLSKPGKNIYT